MTVSWYSFDPFKYVPRKNATVGALRKAAAGHYVSIQARSHHPKDPGASMEAFVQRIQGGK